MADFLDWLTGRERARREADAERARQATREAQERSLDERAREAASKQPHIIRRTENEPRPGERFMPGQAERMRAMHDNPPQPREQAEPAREREATRMGYTRTAQPAPSMGGAGTKWINNRARQPEREWADEVLGQARAALESEDAALTPEQRKERDRQQALELERTRKRDRLPD